MTAKLPEIAELVIAQLYSKKAAFKNALYTTATNKQLSSAETKQLFAICAEISKQRKILFALEKELASYASVVDRNMLEKASSASKHVYIYELILAKTSKKPKSHEISKIILKHRAALREKAGELKAARKLTEKSSKVEECHVDRYARINRITVDQSTSKFIQKQFSKFTEKPSADDQLDDVILLPKSMYSTIHEHKAVQSGDLILQDKASCLPPMILLHGLRLGSHCEIVDACSAPGNKTTGLAAELSKRQSDHMVHITACEMDVHRHELLRDTLIRHSAIRVKTYCGDFFLYEDQKSNKSTYPTKYCLLDPSCSGSGMRQKQSLDRNEAPKDDERVAKLASFQLKLLNHALSIPTMERVVYSTCSIYREENEAVVEKALERNKGWKLLELPEKLRAWGGKGKSRNKSVVNGVLRLTPEKHRTQGFFVAGFEKC